MEIICFNPMQQMALTIFAELLDILLAIFHQIQGHVNDGHQMEDNLYTQHDGKKNAGHAELQPRYMDLLNSRIPSRSRMTRCLYNAISDELTKTPRRGLQEYFNSPLQKTASYALCHTKLMAPDTCWQGNPLSAGVFPPPLHYKGARRGGGVGVIGWANI